MERTREASALEGELRRELTRIRGDHESAKIALEILEEEPTLVDVSCYESLDQARRAVLFLSKREEKLVLRLKELADESEIDS